MFENLIFPRQQQQNPEFNLMERQVGAQEQANILGASQEDYAQLQNDEAKADLIRWQQEMEEELIELCLSFLSLVKVKGEIKPILDEEEKPIKPLCNKRFIDQVVKPTLKPYMSKNLINSKYDQERILQKLRYTANDIVYRMANAWTGNSNEFLIEFRDQELILRAMKNYMEDACNRALGGWTKKTDSEHSKVITAHMDTPPRETKKGFLGLGR